MTFEASSIFFLAWKFYLASSVSNEEWLIIDQLKPNVKFILNQRNSLNKNYSHMQTITEEPKETKNNEEKLELPILKNKSNILNDNHLRLVKFL